MLASGLFAGMRQHAYPFVPSGSLVLDGTQDGMTLTAFAGDTCTVDGTPARGSKPVLSTVPAQ